MTSIVAYSIAGLSTIAFLTLWVITVYQELNPKKQDVIAAAQQVEMHRRLYQESLSKESLSKESLSDEHTHAAKKMLDLSHMIYALTAKGYNKCLKKPLNCLPGYIMGFRLMDEKLR